MRTTFAALVVFAAVALGQRPVAPKTPPKTDAKTDQPDPKAMPKEAPKDAPKEPPKESPKDPPKEAPKAPDYPPEVLGKTLQQWIKEIEKNPDPSTRVTAIGAVRLFGPTSRQAVPAILNELRKSSNDVSVKAQAIIAIGFIVPSTYDLEKEAALAREPIDLLIQQGLNNQQGMLRMHACAAIAGFGSLARHATPVLAKLSNDPVSWEIRRAACAAMGAVSIDDQGWGDIMALKALSEAITDKAREVRIDAMQAIIGLPPPAPGANINQMRSLMERYMKVDQDKSVVIWTRVALMRLDPGATTETNLTTIAKLMKGQDLDTRIQACKALGVIGKDAKAKVPDLVEVLQSEDLLLVIQACWSLGRMGGFADKAIPALETLLKHKEEQVKLAAEAALKEIKPPPPPPKDEKPAPPPPPAPPAKQ